MDAAALLRQGLGSVIPRPPQQFQFPRGPPPQLGPVFHHHLHPGHAAHQHHRDDVDSDGSHRIAHTLTACCRCRQRKTRCDPTLPRCLPCERSGSICEYFDTTKGKKISRSYVVKLQAKVKQLEADLAQFTDEDDFPRNSEDMVRPGGMVRLDENDETPRYLGPSSGIAMTRLLMEEAKRYTESKRISDLIPQVRARRYDRMDRMQSIVSFAGSISGPSGARKKSYPMISAHAAPALPSRPVADKLVDIFNQRAQVFTPTLHEVVFARELNEVYDGDNDPHKNFMVRMVLAISLQKLDTQYAGLADSYYLAAMQYFEDVVRPKDLRTLQCLALIGQYSLLTPTRTAVYYIIGLATRICQQLGLGDEKTITSGYSLGLVDPLVLDMRRRLSWIATGMEFGLAHSMGRPNGFAKGEDLMDVGYFDARDDADITAEGIKDGPPSEKKLVAIHFCKMRVSQAEIRRVLYEKKRHEPRDENHPWFTQMELKIQDWLDSAPDQPAWCKPWFTGRYHTMIVFLYRPSPQVPKPSANAALKCFDSAAYVVDLSSQQVKKAAIDITWVFLLTVYMSMNTLLWSVSYPAVRQAHPREQLEQLVNTALEIIDQCSERWPGTDAASQHYTLLARACMQSYEVKQEPSASPIQLQQLQQHQQQQQQQQQQQGYNNFATPPSLTDTNSPPGSENSAPGTVGSGPPQGQQQSLFTNPQFGYVFDSGPTEPMFNFDNGFDSGDFHPPPPRHPQFRTGSIFFNPSSAEPAPGGRRPSCFPPDFVQPDDSDGGGGDRGGGGEEPRMLDDPTPPATSTPHCDNQSQTASPPLPNTLPTPPESLGSGPGAPLPPQQPLHASSLSPPIKMSRSVSPSPIRSHHSPTPPMPLDMTPPVQVPAIKFEPQTPQQQQLQHPTPQGTPQPQHSLPISTGPPPQQRAPTFTIPPLPAHHHNHHHQGASASQQHQQQQQRPLPAATTVTDWFNPPPPFISPYQFSSSNANMNNNNNPAAVVNGNTSGGGGPNGFAGDPGNAFMSGVVPTFPGGGFPPPGGGNAAAGAGAGGLPFGFPADPMRQGSLTQAQLAELMGVLETDGMSEINQFLDLGIGLGGVDGGVRWQ